MRIRSIGFKNFRNLKETVVSADAKAIVLMGGNGAGKSSFLECVHSSLLLSTWRSPKLSDAITRGADSCQMRCSVERGAEALDVTAYCDRQKKSATVNSRKVTGYGQLLGLFPVAVMSYDDKKIVTSGPEERRRYANQLSCCLNPSFLGTLKAYDALLKERNSALKEDRLDVIGAIDERLSSAAVSITEERKRVIARLEPFVNAIYADVFGIPGRFSMELRSNCDMVADASGYVDLMRRSRSVDMVLRHTLIGPHRDDFLLSYDGRPVKGDFSTGQIRLLSIILKFAFIDMVRQNAGVSPIVLADDVLLELDDGMKALVFDHMLESRQVFFAFLPQERFFRGRCDDMIIYGIRDGVIGADDGKW